MAWRPRLRWLSSHSWDAGEDPNGAPAAYRKPDALPPWTWGRGRQSWLWAYVGGLVFLAFAVQQVFATEGVLRAVGLGQVVLVGLTYLGTAWVCDASVWTRRAYVIGFAALLASMATFLGWGFLNFAVFVVVQIVALLPWREGRFAIGLWAAGVTVAGYQVHDSIAVAMGLTALFLGWAIGAGTESGRISDKHIRAQQRASVLAISAERDRIGRDLHDILGHSLTAISIKSGLAARLVDRDPDAARAQITEVEQIARQALADVRSTASGMREVRVATEVASARSVLLAAGIEAVTPSAIEPLPDERSDLFGYVVREAVTNVVRHSKATRCVITVTAEEVRVTDDGTGPPRSVLTPVSAGQPGGGSGLAGLTARVDAAGGTLVVEPASGGGTTVQAVMFAPSTTRAGGAVAALTG